MYHNEQNRVCVFMEENKQNPNNQIDTLSFGGRCNREKDKVRVYRVMVTVRESLLPEVVKKNLTAQ